MSLVAVVFIGWSIVEPTMRNGSGDTFAVGLLLASWVGTALLFPPMRRLIAVFVDRVVLRRSDYGRMLDDLAAQLQSCDSEPAVLARVTAAIQHALNATSVTWSQGPSTASGDAIHVLTTEPPHHVLWIAGLTGGRRLLSGDLIMLERVGILAGRRIDALRLGDERYERMLREREISALAAEAELRALRAQINPHFLFNALTTVGYLIQHAPSRALETLMRLTLLLRSVLRSEGEFTTLGHERELIECYLEIERERFEERLSAEIDIPDRLADVPIPALIVQPLVENAIKHGIANARHGGIVRVSARVDVQSNASYLCITVSNTGAPLQIAVGRSASGIGLQNVERRLQCYYGDTGSVTLSRSASGETIATLVLPLTDGLQYDDTGAPVERVRS
jgi:anti-sigma regulatory factor (Ser/Thr protein kinase)